MTPPTPEPSEDVEPVSAPAPKMRVTRRRLLAATAGLIGAERRRSGRDRRLRRHHRAGTAGRHPLRADADGLARGPQAHAHGDRRSACRRAQHAAAAGAAHRRHRERPAIRHRAPARRLHRALSVSDRAFAGRLVVGGAGAARGSAWNLGDPRQSRLVARSRRRAPSAGRRAHPAAREQGRSCRRAGATVLDCRPRRPDRLPARARPLPRRRRFARHARPGRHRRSGAVIGARARHLPARSGAGRVDAVRPHPWRTDPRADDLAGLRSLDDTARGSPTATSSSATAI